MSDAENAPEFPPLLRGEDSGASDPFELAIKRARAGTDPGLVTYKLEPEQLRAAMVLAPENTLEDAMAMIMVASVGFADALGALAPPEVGMHFEWPGILRLNGAKCGEISAAASTQDPDVEPDWLVISLLLRIYPSTLEIEPGEVPDTTSLIEEGCGEVAPTRLLESWARHTLVWINRYLDEGLGPIHADWRSRAYGMNEEMRVNDSVGTFVGLDEKGGLLLQNDSKTDLIPLSKMLKDFS